MSITIKGGQKPKRNAPCPCGSQLKFSKCHGDDSKRVIANRVANLKMVELIKAEKKKQGIIPYDYTCNGCGHGFDEAKKSSVADYNMCPKCDSTDIKINVEEKINESD